MRLPYPHRGRVLGPQGTSRSARRAHCPGEQDRRVSRKWSRQQKQRAGRLLLGDEGHHDHAQRRQAPRQAEGCQPRGHGHRERDEGNHLLAVPDDSRRSHRQDGSHEGRARAEGGRPDRRREGRRRRGGEGRCRGGDARQGGRGCQGGCRKGGRGCQGGPGRGGSHEDRCRGHPSQPQAQGRQRPAGRPDPRRGRRHTPLRPSRRGRHVLVPTPTRTRGPPKKGPLIISKNPNIIISMSGSVSLNIIFFNLFFLIQYFFLYIYANILETILSFFSISQDRYENHAKKTLFVFFWDRF